MKQGLAQIVFLLDRSGSMAAQETVTVSKFNEFLQGQKEVSGEARFKLIQFDDKYEPWENVSIKSAVSLNRSNYQPRGMTALYDAIVRAIDETGEELKALKEEERPDRVVFVVLTDGEENSSVVTNASMVTAKIKHQHEVYSWQFMFLGANQDAIVSGAKMGLGSGQSLSYNMSPASINNTYQIAGNKITMLRGMPNIADPQAVGQVVAFTQADRTYAIGDSDNDALKKLEALLKAKTPPVSNTDISQGKGD